MKYLLSLLCYFSVSLLALATPIPAVSYSPDGTKLAAARGDRVEMIDTKTGQVTGQLTGPKSRISALCFSSSWRLAVASGEVGKSGVVMLYDPNNHATPAGQPTSEFQAHKDLIYAIGFSPDGKLLATGSYDRTVKVWEISTGQRPKLKYTLTDHSDTVYALSFHPSLPILATGSADRAVKVWHVETAARLYTLSDCTDWVYTLAWSPDGQTLVAGGADRSIRAWQANATGGKLRLAAFAHDKPVLKLAFHPSGQQLFSIGEDRSLKVWNPTNLTETQVLSKASSDYLGLAVHPKTNQLAVSQFDGTVQLIDTQSVKVVSQPMPLAAKLEPLKNNSIVRGSTTILHINGQGLETITRVQSSSPSVTFTLLPFPEGTTTRQVEAQVTTDAPLMEIQATCYSGLNASAPLSCFVNRYASLPEGDSTDSARTGQMLKLPVTVMGHLDRLGDADFYRFEAAAGQQVGIELLTSADRGQFEPVISLLAENGSLLQESSRGYLGYHITAPGVYAISVRDRDYRGGANLKYRLSVGPIPILTNVFPLAAPRGQLTEFQLDGVNLPKQFDRTIRLQLASDQPIGSKSSLGLKKKYPELLGQDEFQIIDGRLDPVVGQCTAASTLPANFAGTLRHSAESHLIRFSAKAGESLILETLASRLGSPIDPLLEVLDANAQPVPRVLLRAVAKTFVTFRDHDSGNPGIRLDAWNEFSIDDYVLVNGEVMRIHALPKGPDDDCRFYSAEGRRLGFFDTTPIHQALGTTVFKVEVHPTNAVLPPNGLPAVKLNYINDDGGPGYGKDARISFTAPADGVYSARVRDAHRNGSSAHSYILTIRRPAPSFTVRSSPQNPTVWKGEGLPLSFTASRLDGFSGSIRVRFQNLPKGWTAPAVTIGEGQESSSGVLLAEANATAPTQAIVGIAEATINGKLIQQSFTTGTPKLAEPGDLSTQVNVREVTIKPGAETRILVTIQRRGDFKGRVPVDVRGLPHGVRVLNIGLNGILITPDVTEREVVLYAEPWVKDQEETFVVLSRSERKGTEHAAPAVLLKVKK